jgi:hypothetical protein
VSGDDLIGSYMRGRRHGVRQPDDAAVEEQEADTFVDLDAAATSPPRVHTNSLRDLLEEAQDIRTLGRRFKR